MMADRIGKYELRGTLGRGAMGVVYDGWDPAIGRRVAIKTVRLADADADEDAADGLARFRREAQAAGRLSHPNVVGVFDTGETDELAYIVMEFIEGSSLKDALAGGALPPSRVADIMGQMLAGLEYSHRRGVIHRDIKPANVMLTPEGQVKLADFGIARISSSSATAVGSILGTPAYMPPEQFLGDPADARSDIYAAGAMLFQLLTGSRPYEGNPTTIMTKVLHASAPPLPSQRAASVSPAWDPVIARAMARRQDDRFETAAEFAAAVRAAADAPPTVEDVDATVVTTAPRAAWAQPAAEAATAPAPAAPPFRQGKPASKRGTAVAAAVLACIAVAVAGAAGAWIYLSSQQRTASIAQQGAPPAAPRQSTTAPADTAQPATGKVAIPPPATPKPAGQVATHPVPASPIATATTEAISRALKAAAGDVPCSLVWPAVSGDSISLEGVAGAAAEPALRQAAAQPTSAATFAVQLFDGPYCGVLDALRPRLDASPLLVGLPDGAWPVQVDQLIRRDITTPNFPAYMHVDYYSSDGNVSHLHVHAQNGAEPPTGLYPPRTLLALGEPPGAKKPLLTADPPFGTDMIVAIASSEPLAIPQHRRQEPITIFLEPFRSALFAARKHRAHVAAGVTLVHIVAKPEASKRVTPP